MFDTKDYLTFIIGTLVSIVGSILIYLFRFAYFNHFLYLSIIFCFSIIIYILNNKLLLLKKIGIKKIELNISQGTNTEKLLNMVRDNFAMMGRSGSRFVEAENLNTILSKCDRRTPIRFLFLGPNTQACRVLSRERNVSPNHATDIVNSSLKTLKTCCDNGHNIEVRFYDNPNYIPFIRIIIIDNKEAFLSYYPRGETGKNSFQLILSNNTDNTNNLYQAFKGLLEAMWEVAKPQEDYLTASETLRVNDETHTE